MKSIYTIVIAIVVIAIVIGGVLAYPSLTGSNNPSPTPTPTIAPTASPTANPSASPTATPTAGPTATPTAVPTPSPVPTQLATASILGSGGTLVNPLMQTWVSTYELLQTKVSITYNAVGSGAGILDFQGQLTNFGETDVPLSATNIGGLPSGTTALTIPISASAVVPAYNIQLVNGSYCHNGLNFTGTVLANIFLGTITRWNDAQITALQSSTVAAQLPNANIAVIHRSDSSGTMYAFTDYLSQASSTWNTTIGASKSPAWPVGLGYNLNSGVAAGIIQNPNSIGPLEIAYVLQNPGAIYFGTVQNAAGNYILPSVTTAQAALDAGATGLPAGNNMNAWITVSIIDNIFHNTAATNAYPITTMTYAIVYQEQHFASVSAAQAAATVNFLHWIVNSGQVLGPNAGYVALPASIVAIDNTTLALITYNGQPITILS